MHRKRVQSLLHPRSSVMHSYMLPYVVGIADLG